MKVKYCKWCDASFEADVSYQIYCSSECRESATKEKINDRYIAKRRKQQQKNPKLCRNCGKKLSVYNDDSICENCIINPKDVKDVLRDLRRMSKDD
jgi:hypothetical protein